MEVATVAKEFGAVFWAADLERVAAEEVENFGEGVGGAVRHARRNDGGGSQETFAA
jgi:hypothetical protein